MKLTLKILTFILLADSAVGQNVLTPDSAVAAAFQNHPSVKAAAYDVQAKKYAEKTALNLPNPEVNVESPTGEFYAVGVLQSFEFPTVYSHQKQVVKAETALAQAGQRVSENDLRYTVRTLYLEAQVAEYQVAQWQQRDSLYQQIVVAAGRQFAAGEIDFLQKTLAENEAGKIRLERQAAEVKAVQSRLQLAQWTGDTSKAPLLPLAPNEAGFVLENEKLAAVSPRVAYEKEAAQVAERQADLAKSRALPNFSLGYLNQGASNTPIDYRFRASVGVPLWFGQYRAGRQAAESEAQAAWSRAAAQELTVKTELDRLRSEAVAALMQVQYAQQEALPRSQALIAAAARMREAGQIDYVIFLRTLDEAYAIRRDYANQLQAFETARIQMLYLAGQ
jgi:outer membrane protein TolC